MEEQEEEGSFITLTDDDGNDVSFEVLDTIEYKDRTFAVLLPFDDQDDEVVILEMLFDGEDSEYVDFVSVDDEALIEEVFEEFLKREEEAFSEE
ncbi:MAG: DUF1292 domain-containing protein [Ruminococcus sp.]|nr:DUF1292 domain-containing protein [Ruminococcus sp.]